MRLSKQKLADLDGDHYSIPPESIFQLPERVLQFGTGVLLRALPDYYIDKANKQELFNGRIVVVKSTSTDGVDDFALQDGLYTHCTRGLQDHQLKENYIINAAISRVLSAKTQWEDVLDCAINPDIEIIISNTTEAGIVLMESDDIFGMPPVSYPAKLLAFLYRRYQCFKGDINQGLIIIPTELIVDNGKCLMGIILELAELNRMEEAFITWLEFANCFCNSLVDRIVPGKLPAEQQAAAEALLGYTDPLMIMSEPYALWAIETSSEKARKILSFAAADETIIITTDIGKYRELKLRLLNGTHSFSCGLAFLSDFEMVKEAMNNQIMATFIRGLLLEELAPCVVDENNTLEAAREFSEKVLERFSNPFIDHKWLNISLHYSQKMRLRNVPLLIKYEELYHCAPAYMSLGFAAYIYFMRGKPGEEGRNYGNLNGRLYLINDECAVLFGKVWNDHPLPAIPAIILGNETLWGVDLNRLDGFTNAVKIYLTSLSELGVRATLNNFLAGQNLLPMPVK